MKLLNEVGEKLYILELQKDDIDYNTFAEAAQIAPQSNDELDPLEKVVKWRKDLNKPSSTRPHVPHSMNVDESIYSNVPSGYGSNSTSPTPFVGNKKAVSSERSSFEERSPGMKINVTFNGYHSLVVLLKNYPFRNFRKIKLPSNDRLHDLIKKILQERNQFFQNQ